MDLKDVGGIDRLEDVGSIGGSEVKASRLNVAEEAGSEKRGRVRRSRKFIVFSESRSEREGPRSVEDVMDRRTGVGVKSSAGLAEHNIRGGERKGRCVQQRMSAGLYISIVRSIYESIV